MKSLMIHLVFLSHSYRLLWNFPYHWCHIQISWMDEERHDEVHYLAWHSGSMVHHRLSAFCHSWCRANKCSLHHNQTRERIGPQSKELNEDDLSLESPYWAHIFQVVPLIYNIFQWKTSILIYWILSYWTSKKQAHTTLSPLLLTFWMFQYLN